MTRKKSLKALNPKPDVPESTQGEIRGGFATSFPGQKAPLPPPPPKPRVPRPGEYGWI